MNQIHAALSAYNKNRTMDFGRIFQPYGMKRNLDGDWILFNKHEQPIGCHTPFMLDTLKMPVRHSFKGLGEAKLRKLAHDEKAIMRDRGGKICRVYFYLLDKDRNTPAYLERLAILDGLQINLLK